MPLGFRDHATNGDGSLDERLYVGQDANYNVVALFDNSGNVVERYAYDPFGQTTVLDADFNLKSGGRDYAWFHLHQGGRYDSVSGLYHFRDRDYSPTLGRWTRLDPIRYAAGDVNLYRALGNSLTNTVDPSGLVEQYVRNFWNSFSAEVLDKSHHLRAARSFYHIHHTKPQYFEAIYIARGINIHQAEYLVLVHPVINMNFERSKRHGYRQR